MSDGINNMQVVEVRGIRVLTTKQLAEAYGTTQEKIRWNFKYNRDKYMLGKHFIKLEGKELREWKERVQFASNHQGRECEIHTLLKQAKSACLWTERGALLHAKSLNTDQAWEVYDRLVDFYFRAKERQQDKPKEQKAAVAPVQQTVPVHKAHPMKITVVDVPDNAQVQEVLKKLRKDIAGIDAVIDQFSRYITKEDYERLGRVADLMAMGLYKDTLRLADIHPNVVEKTL